MSAILGRTGVLIKEDDILKLIGIDNYIKMKKTFKKTIMIKHGQYKTTTIVNRDNVKLGQNNKSNIVLKMMRFVAETYYNMGYIKSIKSSLYDGEVIKFPDMAITPYAIQQLCCDHIMANYFNKERVDLGFGGVILELEAGLGKTYTAALIAKKLSLKTLYIVPSSEYLMEQAIDDFKKCFPNISIGKYYGRCKTDGDIVFMIINSVCNKSFTINNVVLTPKEYYSRFGLTIWDEAHEYSTKERSNAFVAANTKYMLGLTAEANNREDKCDFISHYGIGPVLIADQIPGYDVPIEDRYEANIRIIKYRGPPQYTKNIDSSQGLMIVSKMSKQIIQDPYRLQLIVNFASELYAKGHNFFIWCDIRDIVTIIVSILKELGYSAMDGDSTKNIGEDSAHLMGGVKKDQIISAQNARIIVATYQYAYRGVSLPKFDGMIFATPRRAKIMQTLKRIFRMGGDTTIVREIIDIVDDRTKLKNQLSSRRQVYKSDVFKIDPGNPIVISYDDIDVKNIDIFNNVLSSYEW